MIFTLPPTYRAAEAARQREYLRRHTADATVLRLCPDERLNLVLCLSPGECHLFSSTAIPAAAPCDAAPKSPVESIGFDLFVDITPRFCIVCLCLLFQEATPEPHMTITHSPQDDDTIFCHFTAMILVGDAELTAPQMPSMLARAYHLSLMKRPLPRMQPPRQLFVPPALDLL